MTLGDPTAAASLRYVVLRHDGVPEPHFDLMFETSPGSPLATWRADAWPVDSQTNLTPLSDHRAAYLDYEGPVSGNRGTVRRVTRGMHRVLSDTADALTVRLDDSTTELRLPKNVAVSPQSR